jgi:hypothetical protein
MYSLPLSRKEGAHRMNSDGLQFKLLKVRYAQ